MTSQRTLNRKSFFGALMGAMFDRAFRMFTDAFEKRADQIYGTAGAVGPEPAA